jgi:hypothetical protein
MNTIPSVEKFYALSPEWGAAGKDLHEAMVEFAKLHVTAALKAASEKAEYKHNGAYILQSGNTYLDRNGISIRKESILNAYPLDENIK